MGYEHIFYEKDGATAIITINRPEVRNALNMQAKRECLDAVLAAEADDQVKVVILTGAGDKAFIAGADIGELNRRTTVSEISPAGYLTRDLGHKLENLSKPTIAAINGYAFGGGCELALACTLRIASDRAKMGLPEINLGIIPGNGGTQRLARLVGKGRALQMILMAETVDAQEAYRIGLVNHVVPHEQLMDVAKEWAAKLASKPPLAIMAAKQAVNASGDLSMVAGVEFEAKLFAILCGTEDKAEGVAAFLEKRQPIFKGR